MKKIVIKNFKCFEEQEVNFKNLTILAGANGSGKSTVIQVLLLFLQSSKKHNFGELLLNGYYIEAGTAGNILYENAKEDYISFELFFDNGKNLLYKYNIKDRDSRILELEYKKNIDSEDEVLVKKASSEIVKRTTVLLEDFLQLDFISADRYGPKLVYKTNNEDDSIGKYGEFVPYIIDQYKLDILENKKVYFNSDIANSSLITEINNWLGYILDGVRIDTEVINNVNISMLKMTNYPQTILDYKSPTHMPYGASYVLPIILGCLLHSESGYKKVIIENPEAHLHPSAQSKLGKFLAKMAYAGVQIIIETHSDHIINGIRIAIKNKEISNNDVIFNSFSKGEELGENFVEEISIDENGRLNKWPEGFFDQYEKDMMELI